MFECFFASVIVHGVKKHNFFVETLVCFLKIVYLCTRYPEYNLFTLKVRTLIPIEIEERRLEKVAVSRLTDHLTTDFFLLTTDYFLLTTDEHRLTQISFVERKARALFSFD